MITIDDLITLFTYELQQIEVYDLSSGEIVYRGTIEDMPQELLDYVIESIDEIKENTITVNIDSN